MPVGVEGGFGFAFRGFGSGGEQSVLPVGVMAWARVELRSFNVYVIDSVGNINLSGL